MNIVKIQQKLYHEITVDEEIIERDFSKTYIRMGTVWFTKHREGALLPIPRSFEKILQKQFYDMNNIMHEQLELYENDYSR